MINLFKIPRCVPARNLPREAMDQAVKTLADGLHETYGFMAVNSVLQAAAQYMNEGKVRAAASLEPVYEELLARGVKVIRTEEEYLAGVAEFGVPPGLGENEDCGSPDCPVHGDRAKERERKGMEQT